MNRFRRLRIMPALAALAVGGLVGCSEAATPREPVEVIPTGPVSGESGVVREVSRVNLASVYTDLSTLGSHGQRVIGWNRLEGTSTFLGIPVTVKVLGAVEYTHGSGPFDGYVQFIATDGSRLAMYLDGQANAGANTTELYGRMEFVGATGIWKDTVAAGEFRAIRGNQVGARIDAVFKLVAAPKSGSTSPSATANSPGPDRPSPSVSPSGPSPIGPRPGASGSNPSTP